MLCYVLICSVFYCSLLFYPINSTLIYLRRKEKMQSIFNFHFYTRFPLSSLSFFFVALFMDVLPLLLFLFYPIIFFCTALQLFAKMFFYHYVFGINLCYLAVKSICEML